MDLNYTLINGYEQKQNLDVAKLPNGAVLQLDKDFDEGTLEIPRWVKGDVILPKTITGLTYNYEITSVDDISANINSVTYLCPNSSLRQEGVTFKQKCYPFTIALNGVGNWDKVETIGKGIVINVEISDILNESVISIGTSESPYFDIEEGQFVTDQFITLQNFSQTQFNTNFTQDIEQQQQPYTMQLQFVSPTLNQTIQFDITDYYCVNNTYPKWKIEYSGLNNLLPIINETFPNYKFDYLGFRFCVGDSVPVTTAGKIICDVLETPIRANASSIIGYH